MTIFATLTAVSPSGRVHLRHSVAGCDYFLGVLGLPSDYNRLEIIDVR